MRILKEIQYCNHRNKDGFTITEVVVSALIFAIATAGILATATTMRKPAVDSSEDVTAAFLAKRILDDLRSNLDSVTWSQSQTDGGPFEENKTYTLANSGLTLLAPVTIDSGNGHTVTYTPSYTVVRDPHGTRARMVNLTIDWLDNN